MSRNILKSWKRFVNDTLKVKLPVGPNLTKDRSYKNVEIKWKFEELEKERKLKFAKLDEYRNELKLKELEYQLNILKTNLKPEEYSHEIEQIDSNLANDLKLMQMKQDVTKFNTFEEFRAHKDKMKKLQLIDKSKVEVKPTKQKSTMEIIDEKNAEIQRIKMELIKVRALKNELKTVDSKLEDLEADFVILEDIERDVVLCGVMYFDFLLNQNQGFLLNPETKKNIEYVHYQVENNLPIRRELLYDTFPEIFDDDLRRMPPQIRKRHYDRRPQLYKNDEVGGLRYFENEEYLEEDSNGKFGLNLEYATIINREREFDYYVSRLIRDFNCKYDDHFNMKTAAGYGTPTFIIDNIFSKPEEKLTDTEKMIKEDLIILNDLEEDFRILCEINIHLREEFIRNSTDPPIFVRNNPKLMEHWNSVIPALTEAFRLGDSIFCADKVEDNQSEFSKVLLNEKKEEVDKFIKIDDENYKRKLAEDKPIPKRNRNEKDMELHERLKVITDAMEIADQREKAKLKIKIDEFEEIIALEDGEEEEPDETTVYLPSKYDSRHEIGRITVEEIPKVLYLNATDPQKYNLQFWADYFKVEPKTLKNIFNYVSYALPDVIDNDDESNETGRLLRFKF